MLSLFNSVPCVSFAGRMRGSWVGMLKTDELFVRDYLGGSTLDIFEDSENLRYFFGCIWKRFGDSFLDP